MLCGSAFTMYCVEKYNNLKKENYGNGTTPDKMESARALVVISLILFMVEFLLLFYAITTAIYWPVETTLERFVHVFFSVFLTIPYILVTIVAKFVRAKPIIIQASSCKSRRSK